jgi:hypothetical protein
VNALALGLALVDCCGVLDDDEQPVSTSEAPKIATANRRTNM